MIRLTAIATLLFLVTFTQCSSPASKPEKIAGTKVPTEWIEQVRAYNRGQDTLLLLKQLEGFIAPDTIDGKSEIPHPHKGVDELMPAGTIRPLFVNLDEDPAEELIGIFSYGRKNPMLAVFKLINNFWYLLYHESYYDFYHASELKVGNNFSTNKVFYINCLYERGSGIYLDAYRFFKLINNKVYPCLELTKDAHIYGWGLNLNQEDSTSFQIDSTQADKIVATYSYNFFPAYDDAYYSEQIDISFAKGVKTVNYNWDKATFTYQPELKNTPGEMTLDKIKNLGRFGDDSLFTKAFDYEINQLLKTAPPKQKKRLEKYLVAAKRKPKAAGATSEMQETTQVGDLKFYKPKK